MNTQAKNINVIQFLSFEDLGNLKTWLRQANYHVQIYQAGVDDLTDVLAQSSPLIILGGPIGVYETETYPFLNPLIEQLKIRLAQNLPTLGICLGAQLIATALGAKVYAGHTKEIGWSQLTLTTDHASPLQPLQGIYVLHWHGDTFDLPQQATLLASSEHYPHQAFSVGNNILGLQFHIEVEPKDFERWLIGHACELSHANIDITQLRLGNQHYGQALISASHAVFKTWLEHLEH